MHSMLLRISQTLSDLMRHRAANNITTHIFRNPANRKQCRCAAGSWRCAPLLKQGGVPYSLCRNIVMGVAGTHTAGAVRVLSTVMCTF